MHTDNPLDTAQTLLKEGRAQEAAALLQSLVDSGRAGLLARLTYARALSAADRTAEALAVARETTFLFPGVALAALGLGETLLRAHQLPTAIAELQRALRSDPELHEARYLLGSAWLEAGESDNALREFQMLPEDTPLDIARSMAEAQEIKAQPRSNERYVRHLFDQFSTDYDERMLGHLAYSAPRILRELSNYVIPGLSERHISILDLGCGTGLGGMEFQDTASAIDGIDLSPAMIGKARAREIYRELSVGDIEGLHLPSGTYDLVIAADTLVYLGDLCPVFAGVSAALSRDGFFLFTVESSHGGRYELGPKRRWRHSEAYLRNESARQGFTVRAIMPCSPRTEAGAPIEGLAIALQKERAD